jgi:hypothetical protein
MAQPLHQQRLKLLWFVWSYAPLFSLKEISLLDALRLLWRFLVIDWNVLHGHHPGEISVVCKALSTRRAREGEILLEAGCFNGGSAAKFSIICKMLGYELFIYDSFLGVEAMTEEEKLESFDYSGQYAATDEVVRQNVSQYGEISGCAFHKGWFSETLARAPVPRPIRIAYIDCDVAKGTKEALQGIVPALVDDGCIFSQDFHIKPVAAMLLDPDTWVAFCMRPPSITRLTGNIACLRFL